MISLTFQVSPQGNSIFSSFWQKQGIPVFSANTAHIFEPDPAVLVQEFVGPPRPVVQDRWFHYRVPVQT